MNNLLNNELKVKLDSFKKLTQMELFSKIDEYMGTLSVERVVFINCYAVIGKSVPGLSEQPSLTGRPIASREKIPKLFFLKSFLNPIYKGSAVLIHVHLFLEAHLRL